MSVTDANTEQALEALTDAGQFEKLATSVLRLAVPQYRSLVHPGANADGKTVKAPVDGITFEKGVQPPHLIGVHHTTCAKSDLKTKWMLDPTLVKQRKKSAKPPDPGDILKFVEIAEKHRSQQPQTRCTLVLTTNREPSVDDVREANLLCNRHDIELDIWSRSRLADFLDQNPEGQYVRQKRLGIQEERLSLSLALDLSINSLDNFQSERLADSLIERQAQRKIAERSDPLLLVQAPSGYGKTALCCQRLRSHINSGGIGLVLPHELVESAHSLDEAVFAALKSLHPKLTKEAGSAFRRMASSNRQALFLIEDINQAASPVHLLQKLLRWARPAAAPKDAAKAQGVAGGSEVAQIICPVWPDAIALLSEQERREAEPLSIELGPFEPDEATAAVHARGSRAGEALTQFEAQEIANSLGRDPLLIALYEPGGALDSSRVVSDYIDSAVRRLAAKLGTMTPQEIRHTLNRLSFEMLKRRTLTPTWAEAKSWFDKEPDTLSALRSLCSQKEIVRIAVSGQNENIQFRHDRVRDSLIVGLLVTAREEDFERSIVSDPFYARYLGEALAIQGAEGWLQKVCADLNPLALFYALKHIGNSEPSKILELKSGIVNWLSVGGGTNPEFEHLRWQAQRVLSQTVSPAIVDVVSAFQAVGGMNWLLNQALFRNGRLEGGLGYFGEHQLGVGVSGRKELVEYVKTKHGDQMVDGLCAALSKPGATEIERSSGLVLCGYLQRPAFGPAIWKCWELDEDRVARLDEYIWAAAHSGGTFMEQLFGAIFIEWEHLPESDRPEDFQTRSDVAIRGVNWAFEESVPTEALPILFKEVNQNTKLSYYINEMVRRVDCPEIQEHIVRYVASIDDEIEGTERYNACASSWASDWHMRSQHRRPIMSLQTKQKLQDMWSDQNESANVRRRAFHFWVSSRRESDLEILRAIGESSALFDMAMRARLALHDKTALPFLLQKLDEEGRKTHWWHYAKEFPDQALVVYIESCLSELNVTEDEVAKSDFVWSVSAALVRLATDDAERILLANWQHLGRIPRFLQVALFHATPKLIERVESTISQLEDPKVAFELFGACVGLRTYGEPGLTRRKQMEAIAPYAGHMSQIDARDLWDCCNQYGWHDLRNKWLDALLLRSDKKVREAVIDEGAFEHLDESVKFRSSLFHEHWIEDATKAGKPFDALMDNVFDWLNRRGTMEAFQVASGIVESFGMRGHLEKLGQSPMMSLEDARIRFANCEYSTRLRTLH